MTMTRTTRTITNRTKGVSDLESHHNHHHFHHHRLSSPRCIIMSSHHLPTAR